MYKKARGTLLMKALPPKHPGYSFYCWAPSLSSSSLSKDFITGFQHLYFISLLLYFVFFSIHLFGLWELLEEEEREAFLTRNFLLLSWNRNSNSILLFCNIFRHTVTGFINILPLKNNISFDCVHSLLPLLSTFFTSFFLFSNSSLFAWRIL